MLGFKSLLILALGTSTMASPLLQTRQCVEGCGNTCYYQSDINDAVNQGCNYYTQGEQVGSGKYPHEYKDYEGFSLPDSGPFYEFPILSSYKVYTGGSPGPDRVVFNADCSYEAVITHTGANGNDFLQCKAE